MLQSLKHIFSRYDLEYILEICFFVYDFENVTKSHSRTQDNAAICFEYALGILDGAYCRISS